MGVHFFYLGGSFCSFFGGFQSPSNMEGGPSGASQQGAKKRRNRGLKRKQQGQRYAGNKADDPNKPSRECRDEVLRAIYRFFVEHPMSFFSLCYLQHTVEVGKAAFTRDVRELIDRVIGTDKWRNERMKSGYVRWVEDRIHDAMWNPTGLAERFAKEEAIINSAEYVETKAKLRQWHEDTRRWKSRGGNYLSPIQQKFRGDQLVYLAETADVQYLGDSFTGGYGVVRKCHIQNDPSFPRLMMLASKTAHQMPTSQKTALFNAEALAVRSPHRGCIKWVAVHHTREEGFTLWWNGGTIRNILADDNKYGEDPIESAYAWELSSDPKYRPDSYDRARQVALFRNQRTELAWTLLNIMNNIHQSHILHNDLSPDNILLHFEPENHPQQVYIGVCDWALSSNSTFPRESVYWASTMEAREKERSPIDGRWWVAPELYYFPPPPGSVRDVQFESKPRHTFQSETYAIGKIALRIAGRDLSHEYFNMQCKEEANEVTYSYEQMNMFFHMSLEQLCNEDPANRRTLAKITNRLMHSPLNWPLPHKSLRPHVDA